MRRTLQTLLVALFALIFLGCSPGARAPSASAAADLEAKTVAIVAHTSDGETRPFCSGTWVGKTTILTAAHCVSDGEIGSVFEYVVHEDVSASRVLTHEIRLVAVDGDHDLALLRAATAPPHRVAHVSLETPRPGSFAQTMGHPRGLWWSYSSGDIASVRTRDLGGTNMLWVQSTAPISPGNSGCGLFDIDGDLIGVASRAIGGRAQGLNFFVPSVYVDALVRKNAS